MPGPPASRPPLVPVRPVGPIRRWPAVPPVLPTLPLPAPVQREATTRQRRAGRRAGSRLPDRAAPVVTIPRRGSPTVRRLERRLDRRRPCPVRSAEPRSRPAGWRRAPPQRSRPFPEAEAATRRPPPARPPSRPPAESTPRRPAVPPAPRPHPEVSAPRPRVGSTPARSQVGPARSVVPRAGSSPAAGPVGPAGLAGAQRAVRRVGTVRSGVRRAGEGGSRRRAPRPAPGPLGWPCPGPAGVASRPEPLVLRWTRPPQPRREGQCRQGEPGAGGCRSCVDRGVDRLEGGAGGVAHCGHDIGGAVGDAGHEDASGPVLQCEAVLVELDRQARDRVGARQ